MKKKQFYDKEGNEYYYRFKYGSYNYNKIVLYKKVKRKYFPGEKFIHLYTYEMNFGFKNLNELSVWGIKERISKLMEAYNSSILNRKEQAEWDGILATDPGIKKQIIRDKRLNKLLKGDTSKLERFLESDES